MPDLKARVILDDAALAAAGVKAAALGELLKKELGGSTGQDVDRSMRQVGQSLDDAGRKAEQAGQAFIRFGDHGEVASVRIASSTARSRSDLDLLEQRARRLADTLGTDLAKGTAAVVKLGADGADSLARLSTGSEANVSIMARLGSAAVATGAAISTGFMPVVIGLAVALSPLVVLLGAFATGLSAVLTVIALAGGAFLGLGAGIVALATVTQHWLEAAKPIPQLQSDVAKATNDHEAAVQKLNATQQAYNATATHNAAQTLALHQAQQQAADTALKLQAAQTALTQAQQGAVSPLTQLKENLESVANTLGAAAVGPATQLLNFFNNIVSSGVITRMGTELLSWFGDRLPAALPVLGSAIDAMFSGIERLGRGFGSFFDQVLARAPALGPVLAGTFNFLIDAIVTGLLPNLLRLTDWFISELPTIGPAVSAVFSFLGSAAQWLGQAFAWVAVQVALLISGHSALTPVLHAVAAGVQAVTGFFQQHGAELSHIAATIGGALVPVLQFLSQHLTAITVVAGLVVVGFLALVAVIAVIVGVIGAVIAVIAFLAVKSNELGAAVGGLLVGAFNAFNAAQSAVIGVAGALIGLFEAAASVVAGFFVSSISAGIGILGAIGGAISTVLGALGHLASAISSLPSIHIPVPDISGAISTAIGWIDRLRSAISSIPSPPSFGGISIPGFQHGGLALPGQMFTVGEAGPEVGFALPGGGVAITPTSAGGVSSHKGPYSVVINVSGTGSPEMVALAIDRRLADLLGSG